MLNRLKEATFVLENTEQITIPGRYFGQFHIGDIHKEISRIALNAIEEMDVAYEFGCEIHADGNKGTADESFHRDSAFERLTAWHDICSVEFTLVTDEVWFGLEEETGENSKKYDYFIHWDRNDCYYNNAWQREHISKNGWLYIRVDGGSGDAKDIFSELIDEPSYAEASEEAYDIGDICYAEARAFFTEH